MVSAFAAAMLAACAPIRPTGAAASAAISPASPVSAATPSDPEPACRAPDWTAAAAANAASLQDLAFAPFGRPETGWAIYAPFVQQMIGSSCPPDSETFAAQLAAWQAARGLPADGVMSEAAFALLKGEAQAKRPFVATLAAGICPETADVIAQARPQEGSGGKTVWLRPAALAAYRRLVAAARAEVPGAADDPDFLTIFSGYRSPSLDAARCLAEGNCDGVVRARCSAHRTGLAMDLYLGHAQGFSADSTASENRLVLSRTPAYRWLLANARRFGFVNYPFEPWHWEWTGEAP
jgi:hypothetical protein